MLPSQARIAVVAPSHAFDPARVEAGMAVLRGWGYRPELLPHTGERHRSFAGDDAARLSDLRAAIDGPWDAVWMARGGYGLARLLPELSPFDRPFFGFSDGSALLSWLADAGGRAVHAPVLHSLGDQVDEPSRERLRALLAGEALPPLRGEPWREGEARGPLRGGNLCVLASSCGTPWRLRGAGAIVLLEEVAEPAYKVDRMLTQLRLAGAFEGVAGFVLGRWEGCTLPKDADWTLRDVLLDRLGDLGVPILAGLPVGHGSENHALPFGPARIVADRLEVAARWS